VSSEAQVYKSVGDAVAAFTRDTSRAGISCLKSVLRREFAKEGLRLVSFRSRPFPRRLCLPDRALGRVPGSDGDGLLDAIVLLRSRAEVSHAIGSALAATKALEVRLARKLAARMTAAMRGA
jgi:hypothetical protein